MINQKLFEYNSLKWNIILIQESDKKDLYMHC